MITRLVKPTLKRNVGMLALGMALSMPVYAELSNVLTQDLAMVSVASAEQRQSLANSLELGVRAGLNEQDLSGLLHQGAAKNYAGGDLALYVDKLASLQRAGLPIELVRDKMLEGMAKSAPAAAIQQAANHWSAALEDANLSLRGLEQKGLRYASPSEKAALINDSATLQQRYGIQQPLLALSGAALESGQFKPSAASLHAAAGLTELLLLRGVQPAQAMALPAASLGANDSAQRIQQLQKAVVTQLRQGVAAMDIAAASPRALLGNTPSTPNVFSGNPAGPGGPGGLGGPGGPGGLGGPGGPGGLGGPGSPAIPAGLAHPGGGPGFPGGSSLPGGPGGFRR